MHGLADHAGRRVVFEQKRADACRITIIIARKEDIVVMLWHDRALPAMGAQPAQPARQAAMDETRSMHGEARKSSIG